MAIILFKHAEEKANGESSDICILKSFKDASKKNTKIFENSSRVFWLYGSEA